MAAPDSTRSWSTLRDLIAELREDPARNKVLREAILQEGG